MRRLWIAAAVLAAPSFAQAQNFDQVLVFGPSLFDSGYFALRGADPAHFPTARNNGGAITPSGGIMNTTILAARFGQSDISQGISAAGTNYAVSGATINNANTLPGAAAAPSIVQQMSNYLASTGGVANANALYLISAGSNDVQPNVSAATLIQRAGLFSNSVTALRNAGARYILIPNLVSGDILNTTIYQNLAAAGVNFIPADQQAMIAAVRANPARFGLVSAASGPAPVAPASTFTGSPPSSSACRPTSGSYSGYGLYCIPSTTPVAGTAYLTSADALQTNLFSDNIHLSPAGQQIQADYYYSLIVAPSQISFLTESTIQARRGVTLGIQEQIDISQRRATPGFNVWFNGDVSALRLNNATGFPRDPSTPISGTLGGSYTFSSNALIGGAVTLGQFSPSFTSGGGFREQEVAATVFGAVRADNLWANAIMSFGWLTYDVNRVVPLGISFDSNQGNTRGKNFSFAALTGYDFRSDAITHGPVAGVEVQSVSIDAFTETGSFTSLAFSNIGRTSTVSALGYRAAIDYGNWRPFAQVTWNHEFDDTANRTVTAALTSMTAPSYSLPIVQLGRDWASAVVGTTVTLAKDWTGLAAFNAQLGQNGATNYGGRFGINYAFNSGAPLITK